MPVDLVDLNLIWDIDMGNVYISEQPVSQALLLYNRQIDVLTTISFRTPRICFQLTRLWIALLPLKFSTLRKNHQQVPELGNAKDCEILTSIWSSVSWRSELSSLKLKKQWIFVFYPTISMSQKKDILFIWFSHNNQQLSCLAIQYCMTLEMNYSIQ